MNQTSGLEGQVVMVTAGAGLGLGAALCDRFAREGATVVVTDVHVQRIHETTARLSTAHPNARVVGYELDAGHPDAIDATVRAVTSQVGPIDVLVNNAAYNVTGTIFDFDPSDWERILAVNLSGPWHLCRRVMPSMRDRRRGVIVNISALASELGGSGIEGAYAVTKGGLNALTRACAVDGAPYGIRANSIALGVIPDTWYTQRHPEILEYSFTKPLLGERPTTSDIAEVVIFLCSPAGRHITGEVVNVSGGMYLRP